MQVIKPHNAASLRDPRAGGWGGEGQDAAAVVFWWVAPARYSETPAHNAMCQVKTSNSNNTLYKALFTVSLISDNWEL